MTGDCSSELFHDLLKVTKPYRYIGHEFLCANKDFETAKCRIALAFPDKYEIAVSNIGQKLLYETVNSSPDFMADRVYAPDFDYLKQIEENHRGLKTLETGRNVTDFDLVGFSLQYEMSYPTILKMLELFDIPLKRFDRGENIPLVYAGGPCCFNPEPVSDFFDFFVVGDGDEVLLEILQKYSELKENGVKRDDILKALSEIDGVYVPLFPKKTRKSVSPFKTLPLKHKTPIPYSSSVQDRVVAEIRRGCSRMCRFCQSGHIHLPVRERKAKDIIEFTKEAVDLTGYNECSLLSLASNDYTNILPVIEELTSCFRDKRVSISLPSQRIDAFNLDLAKLVESNRNKSVTLAIEAGSQRLRDVINKNITEQQIIDTLMMCYREGISTFKLYFMLGLPTETFSDLDEMVELLSKIRYSAHGVKNEYSLKDNIKLNLSVSIFVPKAFTPFQWCGQESEEKLREKVKYLLEKAKPLKNVKINYHDFVISKFEAYFARGDRRLNDFIYALYKKGVYLASWGENVDKELWHATAEELGMPIDEAVQREIPLSEELPWHNIDCGVDDEWFKEQYRLAMKDQKSDSCEMHCVNCGVCKKYPGMKSADEPYQAQKCEIKPLKPSDERHYYRLKLTKEGILRFISHLDWQNTLLKAFNRSNLRFCYSQGFNPTPKISLGIALPIFIESKCELIDICLEEDLEEEEVFSKLKNTFPEGINLISVKKCLKKPEPLDLEAYWARYEYKIFSEGVSKNEHLLYIKDVITSQDEILMEKVNKKGVSKLINIKKSIRTVEVEGESLFLELKVGQLGDIPQVKADEVIKVIDGAVDYKITRLQFLDEQLNEL
ncbi:TIGR03936 family radical SAM-associated protein [bacterium]|nr:TIGR03936 family radical SAM-associated protein [bacterium]